jgi:alcohol dehydrogenase
VSGLAFDFQPPGRVVCGPGTLGQLGELTAALGRRALVVTDPGLEATGHPQRAVAALEAAGLAVAVFDGVKENPTEAEVRAGVTAARDHRADVLVAVGGGSAMDCAKGANFLLTNGGRMSDYKGHGKATKPMLPSVGVPTTAGTGSEAQSYALITDPATHLKMACGDKKAAFRVSVLDPELTLSQPRGVTAVTGIDAVAHAVESLVCTKANPISRMCSLAAWRHLEPNFERVLTAPDDLPARAAMQVGAHLAGMAIENAMLGITHSCANPLTAHYGLTHGVAIGLLMPHVVRFNGETAAERYAELGTPAALADRLAALVRAADLPTRLRDVGVAESILPLLAEEANEQWTARFNPRPVTQAELLAVYKSAW